MLEDAILSQIGHSDGLMAHNLDDFGFGKHSINGNIDLKSIIPESPLYYSSLFGLMDVVFLQKPSFCFFGHENQISSDGIEDFSLLVGAFRQLGPIISAWIFVVGNTFFLFLTSDVLQFEIITFRIFFQPEEKFIISYKCLQYQ